MVKVFKIIVLILFASSILFLALKNVITVNDEVKNIPTEEELLEFSNIEFKSNANTYEIKNIEDKELATIYYNHFKDLIVNNKEEAYKKIKNKDTLSKEDFEDFAQTIISDYYNTKVSNYVIIKNNNNDIYKIKTNKNQTLNFYVKAVFKYEVELLL